MNNDLNEYEEWSNRPIFERLKFKPDRPIVRDALIRRLPELAPNTIRRQALQALVDRGNRPIRTAKIRRLEPTFT